MTSLQFEFTTATFIRTLKTLLHLINFLLKRPNDLSSLLISKFIILPIRQISNELNVFDSFVYALIRQFDELSSFVSGVHDSPL